MDRRTQGRRSLSNVVSPGADYTPEELEFMMAMDRLKRRLGRCPDCREVLAEAVRLGYRKDRSA